jgi:hypothetical protein
VTAGVAEARWQRDSVVPDPSDNSMQRPALRAAADQLVRAGMCGNRTSSSHALDRNGQRGGVTRPCTVARAYHERQRMSRTVRRAPGH